jgi:hypothetical protein
MGRRPVQSLSACTRVQFIFFYSDYLHVVLHVYMFLLTFKNRASYI